MNILIEILEQLKQEEYENYCHKGYSILNESQWDFVIGKVQDKLVTTSIHLFENHELIEEAKKLSFQTKIPTEDSIQIVLNATKMSEIGFKH